MLEPLVSGSQPSYSDSGSILVGGRIPLPTLRGFRAEIRHPRKTPEHFRIWELYYLDDFDL